MAPVRIIMSTFVRELNTYFAMKQILTASLTLCRIAVGLYAQSNSNKW